VKLDPPTLNIPQTGSLTFALTDPQRGKPVTAFEQVSGAILQNILVSRDLNNFRHSYTNELTDNQASVFTYFPVASDYYDYAIFKPSGAPLETFRTNIRIVGRPGNDAQLQEDPSPEKTAGWLTFDLLKAARPIKAGQPTQLAFYVTERDRPVTALWPYLDAPGHLWIIDEKGDNFGHEIGAAASYVLTPTVSATGTPGTENSTAGSSSTGGTGGTGAGGVGEGGTRSGGLGTPEAAPTAGPSPTLALGVQLAYNSAVAQPTLQLAPVQQTPQSGMLSTPEVVPSVGYGPTVAFTHTFPHPGLYKMWLEVYFRGQPIVVDYVVKVE